MNNGLKQISYGKVVVDLSSVEINKFMSDIEDMFNSLTGLKTSMDSASTFCTIISILLEHMVNDDTDNFVDSARSFILEELSTTPDYFKNNEPALGAIGDELTALLYDNLGTVFAPLIDALSDITLRLEKTDERFYSFFTGCIANKSNLYEIEILFQD